MIKSKRFESSVSSATQKMMEYIRDNNITREQIISISHAEYVTFDTPHTTIVLTWEGSDEIIWSI
jgi:hypothetical protein